MRFLNVLLEKAFPLKRLFGEKSFESLKKFRTEVRRCGNAGYDLCRFWWCVGLFECCVLWVRRGTCSFD